MEAQLLSDGGHVSCALPSYTNAPYDDERNYGDANKKEPGRKITTMLHVRSPERE